MNMGKNTSITRSEYNITSKMKYPLMLTKCRVPMRF